MHKIICVGPQWRGSNAGALFKAFSRLGHVVDVVDENYYINFTNLRLLTRIIDKLFFKQHALEFNEAVLRSASSLKPDFVLIYKGAFVFPETIKILKKNCVVVNFYPDVSFRTHGKYLPQTLPLYDWIFTTKTFGISDLKKELGIDKVSFIPHGYDPEIHRPLEVSASLHASLSCDVSFIGTYSPKKEKYLSALMHALPQLKLLIWGSGWEQATTRVLQNSIQNKTVVGDLYALAIKASRINLGILSESVGGASSGDLITSRTFHIPASGGFMLHERTRESVLYYEEDKECVFFETQEELIAKVQYYLLNESERENITKSGMDRAMKEHAIDVRANAVISFVESKLLKNRS